MGASPRRFTAPSSADITRTQELASGPRPVSAPLAVPLVEGRDGPGDVLVVNVRAMRQALGLR